MPENKPRVYHAAFRSLPSNQHLENVFRRTEMQMGVRLGKIVRDPEMERRQQKVSRGEAVYIYSARVID